MRYVHTESSNEVDGGARMLHIWLVDQDGKRLTSDETVHEFENLNIAGVYVKSRPDVTLPPTWPMFARIADITEEDVLLEGNIGDHTIPKHLFLPHYTLD